MAKDNTQTPNVPEPPTDGGGRARLNPRAAGRGFDDDDDDLDLESFGDVNKMTFGMRVGYALTIIGAIVMVGYLVLMVMYPDEYALQEWIGAASEKRDISSAGTLKGFQMGGVTLGAAADDVRRTHPSLNLSEAPNGEQWGRFRYHEGEYRITFRAAERGGRAYQIRSLHYFPKVSYLELLTEITGRYGKPTGSDCGTPGETIAILCRLYWKFSSVKLNAEIRTEASESGNEARTSLLVTAIDTRRATIPSRPKKKKKRSLRDIRPNK